MGIKVWSVDARDGLNPQSYPYPVLIPVVDVNAVLQAVAENAIVAGEFLTPDGEFGGIHPQAINLIISPSAAVTIVIKIHGNDQFGTRQIETVTIAAADVYTTLVFKTVEKIEVVSAGISVNTITIGWQISASTKIGVNIKFKPGNHVPGFGPHDGEMKYLMRSDTGEPVDVDGIDEATSSILLGTTSTGIGIPAAPGLHTAHFEFLNLGNRP